MRKKSAIITITALLLLLIPSTISKVQANGYEVETVGGVLNPTNIIIMLSEAVLLGIIILGLILILALIRIKKTDEDKNT